MPKDITSDSLQSAESSVQKASSGIACHHFHRARHSFSSSVLGYPAVACPGIGILDYCQLHNNMDQNYLYNFEKEGFGS